MRPIKCLHIFFAFGVSSIAQNEYDVLKYNPKPTAADQHHMLFIMIIKIVFWIFLLLEKMIFYGQKILNSN